MRKQTKKSVVFHSKWTLKQRAGFAISKNCLPTFFAPYICPLNKMVGYHCVKQ
jgi:hypothetical protein